MITPAIDSALALPTKTTPRFEVLGISVSATTPDDVIENVKNWAQDTVGRFICIREVPSLMASRSDPKLVQLHRDAEIVTPDGMPLVWMGRGLGYDVKRVCGPDLMYEICVTRGGMGLKHFLYGGKEGVAEQLAAALSNDAPQLEIVGVYSPPFRQLTAQEDANIIQRINESNADVLWVGISSPKQDIWMADHKEKLSQTMVGVGAAFDFLSGQVSRAPLWMQKRGLESVFRLFSEPRRLWKRYLILVPKFLILLIIENSFGTLIKGAMKGEQTK